MKTYSFFFLIFIFLLSACAPPDVATPSPTLASTNTPPSTETPEPTKTLEPTSALIHAEKFPLNSCAQIVEAKTSSAGVLEVVYEGGVPPLNVISKFGMAEYTGLWLWSGDTQAAVHFSLPSDALSPKLSTDHRQIIFRRDSSETQSELWVMDANGKNERKLATVVFDEQIKERYPWLVEGSYSVGLNYGWLPNTATFFFSVEIYGDVGPGTTDKFVLVDADSGRAISLPIPPEARMFIFAPDGSQLAVQTENELRVLSTQDGRVQFTSQASVNNPIYSPDGKYIFYFIDAGILRMDTSDGQQQFIPLEYSTFISPGGDGFIDTSPRFKWIDNSTLLFPSLDSDQRYVVRAFEADPSSWTFRVWKMDLSNETMHPSSIFSGDPSSVVFSPDNNRFAFRKTETGNVPGNLFLADLTTGEILETIADGQFEVWHPDSIQYIYSTGHPKNKGEPDNARYYLAQVGGQPTPMDGSVSDSIAWVAAEWIVTDCQIIHIS